jgi:beta-lactam-binding protein with PASTA domain
MQSRHIVAASLCFLAFANIIFGGTIVYEVQAWIDGKDVLVLQDTAVYWEHLASAAVGRHGGNNYPTTVSAWLDGNQTMNHVQWTPQWPEEPPAEIRYAATSDAFGDLVPPLPVHSDILSVTVVKVSGRDTIRVVESPSAENGGLLAVEFDDTAPSGTDWYTVRIIVGYEGVVVPDVVGMTQADAENTITDTGLNVSTMAEQYSDAVETGCVISQTPEGGTETVRGWAVGIVVSKGPMPTVPDLTNMSRADALDAIIAWGYMLGGETQEYSDEISAGNVITQTPEAGTPAEPGSAIDLVFSLGKAVTVPDLMGIYINDAYSMIESLDLAVGTLKTGYDRSVPEHHVLGQLPAAGQIVPVGTAVSLIFTGGMGWEDDPFNIWTAEQMNSVGLNPEDWGGYFRLMADIDMSAYTGTQYNIIGNDFRPFYGVFDGNGHTISHLTYTTTDELKNAGLFGVTGAATIKDVHLKDVSISAASYVGALIGRQSDGQVLRCSSTGSVAAANFAAVYAGGLIGKADWGGSVTDCRSSCTVTASAEAGASCAGGLVGLHHGGLISRSFATGAVSSGGNAQCMAGGIAGSVEYGGSVKFCCATGSVSAASDGNQSLAGGIAGFVNDGLFTDNYSTGAVTSTSTADTSFAGGLVAMKEWGNIERCYSTGTVIANSIVETITGGLAGIGEGFVGCFWDTETSQQDASAGGTEVVGKTTADMKFRATFTDAGWDFANETNNGTDNIWRMCADGVSYPQLNWESTDGDFACPGGVDAADLEVFWGRWLQADCSADNYFCGGVDLNASGKVDLADFAMFAFHWLEAI